MHIELRPANPTDLNDPAPYLSAGVSRGFVDPTEGLSVLGEVLRTLTEENREAPWGAFWAFGPDQNAALGLCGFKARPDHNLSVEIAYFTLPLFEGRGVASAMARALVQVAEAAAVSAVIAHTLPVENASGEVLRRNGFKHLGRVMDPDDGEVWAWKLQLM
jgi:RimJ/RimL family protein N-acetyltransferase